MSIEDIKEIYHDGYDDNTTAMGKPGNREVFTLNGGIDVSSTLLTLNEDVSGIELPTLLLFAGGEIWYIEEGDITSNTTISIQYSQRAQLGTSAQIHNDGEEVYTYFSGKQYEVLRNILINLEKFPVVKDQQRSAAVVGEAYVDTSTNDLYVSFDGVNYILLVSGDHSNLDDVPSGASDKVHGDQYLNADNLATWHSAIAGSHITGGDDHTHLVDASPITRVVSGSSLPNAEKKGQVYLLDGDLFFSFDGSSWDEFFGIPQGSIVAFPPSGGCPTGWSEYTDLNNAYTKAVQGGTGTKSGSNTHTHSIQEIPEHSHVIPQDTATTSINGSHSHSYSLTGSGTLKGVLVHTNYASTATTSSSGDHTHSSTVEATSTDGLVSGSLVSSITSDSASSEPPFVTATWCKKD